MKSASKQPDSNKGTAKKEAIKFEIVMSPKKAMPPSISRKTTNKTQGEGNGAFENLQSSVFKQNQLTPFDMVSRSSGL